jgi:hypothetical protein
MRFIAVVILLALPGGRAEAEKQDPVGVLEVATRGVSETAGDTFEQGMERALSAVEVPVVRSNRVREQMGGSDFVRGCTFGPCLREVGRATGLKRLLVARIEGAGKSYSVVVSLLETEEGRLLSQVAQSCPVCTVDEAIATATQAVVELLTRREGEARSGKEVVDVPDDGGDRIAKKKKHVRRTGAVFVATGAAALVVAAILAGNDSDAGAPLVGGGVALAGAGLATLLLSVTF